MKIFDLGGIGQRTFNAAVLASFRGLFRLTTRVHIAHLAPIPRTGPLIVASNHVSHFDPPFLGSFFPRPADWMAMEELFQSPLLARGLALTGAFSVSRDGRDRTALRTAARRLQAGRAVGIFPEGGLRAGETSVLDGAPMRPGVGALAALAHAPILPCVIAGTDRLYHRTNWLRRPPLWIVTGEAIPAGGDRDEIHARLATAFVDLKAELLARFHLTENDLPQTPQARKGEDPYA